MEGNLHSISKKGEDRVQQIIARNQRIKHLTFTQSILVYTYMFTKNNQSIELLSCFKNKA